MTPAGRSGSIPARARHAAMACALLALAACGRQDAPPSPAAADLPAAGSTRVADGAPRVVLAPDGVHIDYRVFGQGEPLVVLVHDWSADANYWRAQVADLSRTYTVVAVNLAGHGASGRNRARWSIEAFAGDITAVLAALPEGRVVLVGHGMGAAAALEAARHLRGRVIGLVGVEAFDDLGAAPRPGTEAAAAARIASLRADYIGAVRAIVAQEYFPPDANQALVRSVADDLALAPPEVAIASRLALDDYDPGPALAELAPGLRAEVKAGRGHFPMLEDPQGFNALLRAQIAAFVAASPATAPGAAATR